MMRAIACRWTIRRLSSGSNARVQRDAAAWNVDHAQVALFDSLSEGWWNTAHGGTADMLHQMNPVRVGFVREKTLQHFRLEDRALSPRCLNGLSVLDAGCGPGLLSESLARLGASVHGIDPSPKNIEMAKRHAAISFADSDSTVSLTYECTTSDDLVARKDAPQYDVVCSLEVIEHVPHQQEFVSSLCRLVKPNGCLFISTINRTPMSLSLAIFMAEYVLKIVPRGTHQWSSFVTPAELGQYLSKDQFTIQDTKGMVYNPLTSRWDLSPSNLSVNFIAVASRIASSQ